MNKKDQVWSHIDEYWANYAFQGKMKCDLRSIFPELWPQGMLGKLVDD